MSIRRIPYKVLENHGGFALFGKRIQVIRSNLYRVMQYLASDEVEQSLRPSQYGQVGSLIQDWSDLGTLLEDLNALTLGLTAKAAEEGSIAFPIEGTETKIEYPEEELDSLYWSIVDAQRFLWKKGLTDNF